MKKGEEGGTSGGIWVGRGKMENLCWTNTEGTNRNTLA